MGSFLRSKLFFFLYELTFLFLDSFSENEHDKKSTFPKKREKLPSKVKKKLDLFRSLARSIISDRYVKVKKEGLSKMIYPIEGKRFSGWDGE